MSIRVLLALLCAGFGALAAEFATLRLWSGFWGSSAPAAAVTAGVTVGLWALGAYLAGRGLAPARAGLAAGIALGATALLLPALREAVLAGSVAAWVGAVVLGAVPAVAAGAVLPGARIRSTTGSAFSLYASESVGGALGVLGAFALIASAGNAVAFAAAGAAFALAALLLTRSRPPVLPRPFAGRVPWRLVALAFATGFVGIGMQVVALRVTSVVYGGALFAVAAVLAGTVLGYAAGAALGSRLPARPLPLSLPAAATALGAAATALLLGVLAPWGAAAFARAGEARAAYLATELAATALALSPLGVVLGWAFPLIVEAGAVRGRRTLGGAAAANALGGAVGGAACGLLVLPALGSAGTAMVLVGGAGAMASVLAARPRASVGVLAVTVLAAVLSAQSGIGSAGLLAATTGMKPSIRFARDGATASVIVAEGELEGSGWVWERTLRINGKPDASTMVFDYGTQHILGHLPMAAHPAGARNLLVVGLGSGVTLGDALSYPVASATVVEIEPRVVEAAKEFSEDNRGALDDPRVRVVRTDARTFLAHSRERFDAVTAEPSNAWVAGSGLLFTRDFYLRVRDHLAPGGVYLQWMHLYGMDLPTLKSGIATLADVFPHLSLWFTFPGGDIAVMATPYAVADDGALPYPDRGDPGVRTALSDLGLREVGELGEGLLLTDAELRRFAAGAAVSTDDRARLEFGTWRNVGRTTEGDNLTALLRARQRPLTERAAARVRFSQDLARNGLAGIPAATLEQLRSVADDRAVVEATSLALYGRGHEELRRGDAGAARATFERMQTWDPANAWATVGLGSAAVVAGDAKGGAALLSEAARALPGSVLVQAYLAAAELAAGNRAAARSSLEAAAPYRTASPEALARLGAVAEALDDRGRARTLYRAALRIAPNPTLKQHLLELSR